MNLNLVGTGKVCLIAGGGKTYTDMAAKFCRSEKDIEEIITSEQNKKLLLAIVNSGHSAALEFDDFIFGVEGYARVTEIQLVRKRHASYMVGSGRDEKGGKRAFNVSIPENIVQHSTAISLDLNNIFIDETTAPETVRYMLRTILQELHETKTQLQYAIDTEEILSIIESWYDSGVEKNIPEEDLRYMKPQATSFKAMIKMNASALNDWSRIRMCYRAQTEIRDLCNKMIALAKEASPELFINAGPNCKVCGYCSEGEQCEVLRGKIPTKEEALKILKENYNRI